MSSAPRTLVLDIETRPHLAHVWRLWDENVPLARLVEAGSVICFAAKWTDRKRIEFYSDHHHGHETMVAEAWRLVDEADVVVSYNGRAFDMKHLAREFVVAGMPPPSPYQDVDLYRVVRSSFKFASNKLEHVATELGLGGKAGTGGFELWVECMANDPKAWRTMRRYNRRDVELTEELYLRVLPWVRSHPNVGLFTGERRVCPTCGSTKVRPNGFRHTTAGVYRRLRCEGCGASSREAKRLSTTELRS